MDKYFDYQMRSKIHAQFRKDKVVTVTNSTGYDEIYLLEIICKFKIIQQQHHLKMLRK